MPIMVVGSPLTFPPYIFVSDCLHVSIRGTSLSLLFKKTYQTYQTFDLGVTFRVWN